MRLLSLTLVALVVLACFASSADAYRKRKGHGFATPYWTRPQEEDLKLEVQFRPKDCSRKAGLGDLVKVHYTGTLKESGKVFDSSLGRGQPIEFLLGAGRVIPGWEQGIRGMCAGEKRKITIPPSLAYGSKGIQGVIPGNAYLVFTVEMISVTTPQVPPATQQEPPQ